MMLNSSILHEILNAPESAQITVTAMTGIYAFVVAPKSAQVSIMIGIITLVALLKI